MLEDAQLGFPVLCYISTEEPECRIITAFVFPLFLYLFSLSGVERDSKPLLAVCSFFQQGNLKVLKKRV